NLLKTGAATAFPAVFDERQAAPAPPASGRGWHEQVGPASQAGRSPPSPPSIPGSERAGSRHGGVAPTAPDPPERHSEPRGLFQNWVFVVGASLFSILGLVVVIMLARRLRANETDEPAPFPSTSAPEVPHTAEPPVASPNVEPAKSASAAPTATHPTPQPTQ